jgi:hypothetical protein
MQCVSERETKSESAGKRERERKRVAKKFARSVLPGHGGDSRVES